MLLGVVHVFGVYDCAESRLNRSSTFRIWYSLYRATNSAWLIQLANEKVHAAPNWANGDDPALGRSEDPADTAIHPGLLPVTTFWATMLPLPSIKIDTSGIALRYMTARSSPPGKVRGRTVRASRNRLSPLPTTPPPSRFRRSFLRRTGVVALFRWYMLC